MNKTLENTVRDILSKKEIDFYNKYRTDSELTPFEVAQFQAISIKLDGYKKLKKWINKLAWSCVKEVDPFKIGLMRDVLYEAYVWGKTR